ncbi:hypothetical protein FB45DRAFT_922570 [Roridomyces roridus]|uniref:Uncharacterized protein n=1 Tax=Roridomyces roridus TaxID=1738132 RepID=A0AAD7BNB2_9AGAR|nr:hypothetical protein FB45DRAFT_922570 [Roridomyces roridus]
MEDSYNRPTTTHSLKHNQRVRLMRSTRKVEALLGETPLFVDANSPRNSLVQASDAHARAVYIIPASPRSSSLGVYSPTQPSTSPAARAPRPVLAVRVPSSLGTDFDSPPDSAASQVSFASLIPMVDQEEHDHRLRTRKMARIVRTLGAQVPAELVFPTTAPRQKRISKRRSRQHLLQGSSGGSSGRTHGTIHEDEPEREGEPQNDPERERPLSSPDSESLYSTLSGGDWVPVSSPQTRARPQSHRKRPSKSHSQQSHSHTRSAASAASDSPADSPFSELDELHPEDRPLGYVNGTTHRSEKGWSGEWVSAGSGMQNMDDVARRLRDLRLR